MQERLLSEVNDLLAVEESQRLRRLARVPIVKTRSEEDLAGEFNRNKVGMAIALNSMNVYPGTVFGAEKAARRKKGKAQRKARKVHR